MQLPRSNSPRSGATAASVNQDSATYQLPRTGFASPLTHRHSIALLSSQRSLVREQLPSRSLTKSPAELMPPLTVTYGGRRGRTNSLTGPCDHAPRGFGLCPSGSITEGKAMSTTSASLAKARARSAQKENDAMVYLDGQQVYTCAQCRTHLTSHDDIISKSFHGRHGE